MALRPLLYTLVLALACCGGGGDAPADPAPTPSGVTLGTGDVVLTLDPHGRLTEARVRGDARNLAAADPQPVLELVVGGVSLPIESVSRDDDDLVVSFSGGAASVRLGIEERAGALVARVRAVAPEDAEILRLRLTFTRLDEVDPPLNGTYDETTILAMRSINAPTRCIYRSLPGGVPQPGVEWGRNNGMVGGAAALFATSRASFFDNVNALETAEGLPSPRFDGTAARASRSARGSYLFLLYYQAGDAPRIIEYAQLAGLENVLLLRGLWRKSAGTFALDPARWPGGLPEFQAFCNELHAAGLGVGLHFYGPSISADDPLVTPVPHAGLLGWDCPGLAGAIGASDTTLTLEAVPDLPAASGGGFPGRYVRIGDEIVRYTATQSGPPFAFTGCERGALGTTAAVHAAGTRPRHLATLHDMFLIDPDSALVDTVAANLASIVNAAGIDMVYFDGTALVPTTSFVQRWYYMNRILPAMYNAFDHDVLVQTGMGPGRELDWHLVPRSASADGHGDIKWYLDQRTPSINTIRRGLSIPDVGWYGFDSGRPPDHLEYICAKALAWDCGISLQTFPLELEKDRRAREIMDMVGRYERYKKAGGPPEAIRDALLVQQQDFRLLEDAQGAAHLFQATYDAGRDVRTLTAGAHAWTVGNTEGADRLLGIEITRGEAIRTVADFSATGVVTVDALVDKDPWVQDATNDSMRLVNRVEKVVTTAGAGRSGVEVAFEEVADAAVGGQALALTATSTITRIGWCAVGRAFSPLLDLSGQAAAGLWIHGDGSGVELSIEFYDDQDQRVVVKVPLFFSGWRFHTFDLTPPAAFDATRIKYLLVIADDVPPESTTEIRFALMRATPTTVAPADLTGVSIEVGGRTIALPAALPPGGTARIDALGRLTIWPGGMAAGQTSTVPGGPLTIPVGATPITFRATGPTPYPGDVVVRTSRLVLVHSE